MILVNESDKQAKNRTIQIVLINRNVICIIFVCFKYWIYKMLNYWNKCPFFRYLLFMLKQKRSDWWFIISCVYGDFDECIMDFQFSLSIYEEGYKNE